MSVNEQEAQVKEVVSEVDDTASKKRKRSGGIVDLLRAVGFCGIDESVTAEKLFEISKSAKAVPPEWGVLFRPEMEGKPRFPEFKWVEETCAALKSLKAQDSAVEVLLAGHLCSTRCDEVLNGDAAFVKQLYELGFRRVQVNATKANNVDSSNLEAKAKGLHEAILAVPDMEWILQRNSETKALWEYILNADLPTPSNVSVLFDDSVGRGVVCEKFPAVLPSVKCGYAGGIGPHNVKTVLDSVYDAVVGDEEKAVESKVWIDMESSLRTVEGESDIFDLEKVKSCLQHAEEWEFTAAKSDDSKKTTVDPTKKVAIEEQSK